MATNPDRNRSDRDRQNRDPRTPIFAASAPAELRVTFNVTPGAAVTNPVMNIKEIKIVNTEFDFSWITGNF